MQWTSANGETLKLTCKASAEPVQPKANRANAVRCHSLFHSGVAEFRTDVLEPDDGLIGIGSGGQYALAAARALIDVDGMDAEAIARKAMAVAAEICVYTNAHLTLEVLELAVD